MARGSRSFKLRTIVLLTTLLAVSSPLVAARWPGGTDSPVGMSERIAFQRPRRNTRPTPRVPTPRVDYAKFSHTTHVVSQKLTCDSCHKVPTSNWKEVRKGDQAFPDVAEFPEHETCLNCHRQQFFARERPAPRICVNCHVNVTPRDTTRFLFPSLGDVTDSTQPRADVATEFAINFPHDIHLDVVGSNRSPDTPHIGFASALLRPNIRVHQADEPKTCAVCHQTYQPQGNSDEEYVIKPPKGIGDAFWLKKGTFKTVPNSHVLCFSCHSADSGIPPAPSDCKVCHKLPEAQAVVKNDFDPKLVATIGIADKRIVTTWQRRISSGAFRHEAGEHPEVSCTKCHDVSGLNTVILATKKVPVTSCGGTGSCHVTATGDDGGALNYEIDQKQASPAFVCSKCHISFGEQSVPATHLQALQTPSPK